MAKIWSPWGSISVYRMRSGAQRYRLRGTIEGERANIGLFDSIEDARVQARAMAEELSVSGPALTVAGWGKLWLDGLELEKVKTAGDKRAVWGRYVLGSPLADMPLRKVRAEHLRRWVDDLARKRTTKGEPLGDQTMRNALYCLSAGLRDAHRAGRIASNPARGVSVRARGRSTDEWTHLTLDEIRVIMTSAELPQRPRTIFGVAIYTGLRAGELWGLRWSDVTMKGDQPHITVRRSFDGPTKGKRVRTVPLFPPALALLEAWRQAQKAQRKKKGAAARIGDLVFAGRDGEMHTPGYDAQWASCWRGRLRMRAAVRLHDMRHTFASHLIMGSWGRVWRLEEIQMLLGHASRTTTERYAHLAPDSVRGAATEARLLWRG